MIGRPTYREAITWIAVEDAPGDNDPPDMLRGYLTVCLVACLVADLFGKDQDQVALDVYKERNP